MFGFNYYTPTKVVFGKDTELKVADLIREFGGTKVLIHYGGGSVIRSGLMKRVTDTLDGADISYVMLGGAVPNPHLGLVYEGIELCKKEGIDFLLAGVNLRNLFLQFLILALHVAHIGAAVLLLFLAEIFRAGAQLIPVGSI